MCQNEYIKKKLFFFFQRFKKKRKKTTTHWSVLQMKLVPFWILYRGKVALLKMERSNCSYFADSNRSGVGRRSIEPSGLSNELFGLRNN